jgi:hypothetical protein
LAASVSILLASFGFVSKAHAEPNAAFRLAGPLKSLLSAPNGVTFPLPALDPTPDPAELIDAALRHYQDGVRDYRCLFFKQERVHGRLKKRQGIQVAYREQPLSISMTWIENWNRVKRATYVEGRNVNREGEPCAIVEPAGAIARLVAGEVEIPIHGERARKAGRRTLDEFGFRAMLERFIRVNRLAASQGQLDLRYAGVGTFDRRPTYVIVRELPYAGEGGEFPDARLVLHIDQQWNLPVAAYSYADREEKTLLAAYEIKCVELNPHLSDDAFGPAMR